MDVGRVPSADPTSICRILQASVVYFPEIGYIQGMHFIVRLLVQICWTESEAFWLFAAFCQDHDTGLHLFSPGFVCLTQCIDQLQHLIRIHLPKLHLHFQDLSISVSTFASRWILTLLTETLEPELVVQIWDLFIIDRFRIILGCAVVILEELQLSLLEAEIDQVFHLLQHPRTHLKHRKDFVQRAVVVALTLDCL